MSEYVGYEDIQTAFDNAYCDISHYDRYNGEHVFGHSDAQISHILRNLPVVAIKQPVMCKTCIYNKAGSFCARLSLYTDDDFFCAYGEAVLNNDG